MLVTASDPDLKIRRHKKLIPGCTWAKPTCGFAPRRPCSPASRAETEVAAIHRGSTDTGSDPFEFRQVEE